MILIQVDHSIDVDAAVLGMNYELLELDIDLVDSNVRLDLHDLILVERLKVDIV